MPTINLLGVYLRKLAGKTPTPSPGGRAPGWRSSMPHARPWMTHTPNRSSSLWSLNSSERSGTSCIVDSRPPPCGSATPPYRAAMPLPKSATLQSRDAMPRCRTRRRRQSGRGLRSRANAGSCSQISGREISCCALQGGVHNLHNFPITMNRNKPAFLYVGLQSRSITKYF